ncbi:methyl-accepting chemotaxis protein [Niallia endozanthoxylica]|nr:methyl-accepting chemotaxis protein [Niallia endozanthoxylica]
MRKNLKIVHIVTIMAIIAVLFMGIIGFFSTNRMASMNDDNRLLYNENLIPLTQISSMRGTFSNIRISVRDYSTRQDVKLPDSIQADYKKITDLIHSYSSSRANYIKSSQNDEAMHVKNITKQLSLYLSTWEDAKQEIDTTGILSDTKFDELDLIGTDLYASLTALKEMNEQEAKSANNNSLQTYESSNKTIFYLFSSVAIIFGFIVVITVISIKRSAKEMISLLNTVANGDFTLKIDQGYQNEFGLMKKALANTVEDIKTMILTVKEKSKHIEYQADNLGIVFEEMSAATQSVSQSINEVAKGTSSQSENLADITTILDDFRMEMDSIVISINKVAESAGHVDGMAKDSSTKMTVLSDSIIEVNSAAKALKDKISNLESSINKISNITNLINGIADQTNLLALNASIEAARAGEAGKGFSVVAEEIRKLAEQSKLSSENIHKLVVEISLETKDMVNTSDDMIKDVNDQIEVTNTSVISFKNIIRAINDIIPKMQSINGSMGKLQTNQGVILDKLQGASAVAQEVAASAEEISSSSQQMNASTEEVSASANQLSAISKDVIVEIDKFTL